MDIRKIALERSNPLTQNYINKNEQVLHWYEGHPEQSESWVRRAESLDCTHDQRVDRSSLVEALLSYNQTYNNHPYVLESIEKLRDSDTLVVIGGQQPGLLSGELLVMAKAIHVIQTAKAAEQKLGRSVVPVFWIAGEDHDWDEVDHCYISRGRQDPLKVQIPIVKRSRLPLSFVPMTELQVDQVIYQLDAGIPDGMYKKQVLELYRSHLLAGESLSASFARIVGHLFGKHGLIVMDSADARMRQLEVSFFKKLILNSEALQSKLVEQSDVLNEAGYAPQVDVQINQANIFIVEDEERILLFHDGQGGYVDRKNRLRFSKQQLLERLESNPTLFSTNVLSRPLMQDYLFPVCSAILGPAELAYWGILKPAFAEMNLSMPIVIPRTEWTILDANAQKQLDRFDVKLDDAIQAHFLIQSRERWLAGRDEIGIDDLVDRAEQEILQIHARLLRDLDGLPGVRSIGGKNADKLLAQLLYLRKQAHASLRVKHQVEWDRWTQLLHTLRPLGKPQERVYNIADYLAKYGFDWFDRWVQLADAEYEHHHVLIM